MDNLIMPGLALAFAILSFFAGREWEKLKYRNSKDMELLRKINELFPRNVADYINEHNFVEPFDGNLLTTMNRIIQESKQPDFFFLDKELEGLKKDFISKLGQFFDILSGSNMIESKNLLFSIPKKIDHFTEDERILVDKVNTHAGELIDVYRKLRIKCRQKL